MIFFTTGEINPVSGVLHSVLCKQGLRNCYKIERLNQEFAGGKIMLSPIYIDSETFEIVFPLAADSEYLNKKTQPLSLVQSISRFPSSLEVEGVTFYFNLSSLYKSDRKSVYVCYDVYDCYYNDSPHYANVKVSGCWKNPFSNNELQGYLWIEEDIYTDEELLQALDNLHAFLTLHDLI